MEAEVLMCMEIDIRFVLELDLWLLIDEVEEGVFFDVESSIRDVSFLYEIFEVMEHGECLIGSVQLEEVYLG